MDKFLYQNLALSRYKFIVVRKSRLTMLILPILMTVLLHQFFSNFDYFYTDSLILQVSILSIIYKILLFMLLPIALVMAVIKIWLILPIIL